MIICPNKTSPAWKRLVQDIKDKFKTDDKKAEDLAYLAFFRHGDIPSSDEAFLLLQKQNADLFKQMKDAYFAKGDIREAMEKSISEIDNTLSEEEQLAVERLLVRKAEELENKRYSKTVEEMLVDGRNEDHIMKTLERKGVPRESAWAIIGKAKQTNIEKGDTAQLLEKSIDDYNKTIENKFLGNRNDIKVRARIEARKQQEEMKSSAKDRSHLQEAIVNESDPAMRERLRNAYNAAKDWRNVGMAIHIHMDLKRSPEDYVKYYDQLPAFDKVIADLSQNLSPKQLEIVDKMEKESAEIGKMAKEAGVIQEALEHHVNRIYDFGKSSSEQNFKFSTTTRHSKDRSFSTILQAQAEGFKLKVTDAANNLQILKEEIGNVIESKSLIEKGSKLKVYTGRTDLEGNKITHSFFSTEPIDGYAKIENQFFKKWVMVGKADDKSILFNAKEMMIVDGNIFQKQPIYAPASVAKSLNNIFGKSTLKYVENLTAFNRTVKSTILAFGGFHPVTFTFQHFLTSTPMQDGKYQLKSISPRVAYKEGLKMMNEYSPELERLVKNQMTIGRGQEFKEGENESRTKELMKQHGVSRQVIKLAENYHRWIFESYGAALKSFNGINLLRDISSKKSTELGRELTEQEMDDIASNVSKQMNNLYGGLFYEGMRGSALQDPTARHYVSLGMLAPDWSIGTLKLLTNAFKGNEGKIYRNMWFRVLTRGAATSLVMNMAMTMMDEKDENGNPIPYWEAFNSRYKEAWTQGHLRWLMADATPLYHALPSSDPKKRMYINVFGAFTDPARLFSNPFDYFIGKSSYPVKIGIEFLTAENWQHKTFTDVDELAGIDEKGTYKRDVKDKKTGQIKYQAGESKGGHLKGELLKYSFKPHGIVTASQTPSFALEQIRGMMPTPIQSVLQGATGENDWAQTILQAAGTRSVFGRKGAEDNSNWMLKAGHFIGEKAGLAEPTKPKESTKTTESSMDFDSKPSRSRSKRGGDDF